MSERVLVVDDEPQIQRFLGPALEAAGYDVVRAETGTEALKLAATAAPALVILDLGLPDMDGKEVIARLRAWLPASRRAGVLADTRAATGWIYQFIKAICAEGA